jgi:hypothetical protein
MVRDGRRPAVRPSVLARLRDARLDAAAEDVASELGENSEHPRERSAAWDRHVWHFAERHEADLERRKAQPSMVQRDIAPPHGRLDGTSALAVWRSRTGQAAVWDDARPVSGSGA